MLEIIFQILGWLGAILIVSAFFLITKKKVTVDSYLYQSLNLFGCVGVGMNALHQEAWPSVGIQVVWGVIAVMGIVRMSSPNKNI